MLRSTDQAPRPLETDELASGNAGPIAPGWRPTSRRPNNPSNPSPKHRKLPHQREYLTALSTISAHSGRSRGRYGGVKLSRSNDRRKMDVRKPGSVPERSARK